MRSRGSGFKVSGFQNVKVSEFHGFKVLGFQNSKIQRLQDLGFRVQCSVFRMQDSGFHYFTTSEFQAFRISEFQVFRIQDSEVRVQGFRGEGLLENPARVDRTKPKSDGLTATAGSGGRGAKRKRVLGSARRAGDRSGIDKATWIHDSHFRRQ